jgi:hypothetical protein
MDWIKKTVDSALKEMSKEKIFMMMPGDIPKEMLDDTIPALDDWKGWRAIDSIIDDSDIIKLEKKIGITLPTSYREYLKYKHFYRLRLPDIAVNLFPHPPDKNLTTLQTHIFEYHEPELVIGRKYIYIADFHDYGLLCFDANAKATDTEFKVVYIDHENLGDIHIYADNFQDLLQADSEKGNDFIDKLNELYK